MTISKPRQFRLILASASPRRREILQGLGLRFEIVPSRLPEPKRKPGESPRRYAVRAARAKATDVSKRFRSGIVVGADTIVVVDGDILGKPRGEEEARKMLRRLGGRYHEVMTGLCLVDCASGRMRSSDTISRVHFRRLLAQEIDRYLGTGEYRDKAGAYGIQGYAALFIDRIEGCYFNIVGFPVASFYLLCRKSGVSLI